MKLVAIGLCVFTALISHTLADNCDGENPNLLRYFYDATGNSCIRVSLTVPIPVGQTNVYDDEFTCKKRCIPLAEPRCNPTTDISRMTSGSAARTVFQYQQLATSDLCVAVNPFSSYEQLPLAQNIFRSQQECAEACLTSTVCNVVNPAPQVLYYFDGTNCVQFSSSVPKQPGSNMFDTATACETACKPQPLARCKPTDPALRVTSASAQKTGYFFYLKPLCKDLTYGGYETVPVGGNAFTTAVTCRRTCVPAKRPAACSLAPSKSDAWYFDGTSCIKFKMTVPINPNGNAFSTEDECNAACAQTGAPECRPTTQESIVTPTTSSQTKYSYDKVSGQCRPVTFGGTATAPTQLNYFDSDKECRDVCEKPSECAAVPFPTIPGKYFFDQVGRTCSPVDLKVPIQPSSNVFDSKNECENKCLPELEPDCLPASSDNRVSTDSVNRKLFHYDKTRNSCDGATYNGVINIPDSANFFETKDECNRKCLKATSTGSTLSTATPTGTAKPVTLAATRDEYFECCAWASLGECDRNPLHMKVKCQESCGTPGATQATAIAYTTNLPPKCRLPSQPFTRSPGCTDIDIRCSSWGIIGQCANNKKFMALNCKATCNTCNAKGKRRRV